MGFKKINGPYHWVKSNGSNNMTGTAVVTGAPQDISNFDNIGVQIKYVGTAVGTIVISGSVDGIDYFPLTFSPAITNPSGSSDGQVVDMNQVPFKHLKFTYTNISGSGQLDVKIFEKDLN